MISTADYPYPVNDKSTARRVALQPHICSPSGSHHSPRNTMYPHLHAPGSPSPSYIYSAYEHYCPEGNRVAAVSSSWPTFYSIPPRSLPETAINPKVTIHPQPIRVSDIDTPSSISSYSILTPSSPFVRHDVGEVEFQAMDLDEFDYDDEEEDYIDSDFADEMEGIDGEPSPLYGTSVPHVIKSTSALEGALGDAPSPSYDTGLSVSAPADRRLSASVPGYSSALRRSHQRWIEKTDSSTPQTRSPPVPEPSYPSQHMYTHRGYSSLTSSFPPTAPSLYDHVSSSSSLAGAFASSAPSSRPSRPASGHPLPILQPQPIRPIPPIPLADLASSANEIGSSVHNARSSHPLRTLSPLPLLCQPVSDAVRYQLKGPPADSVLDVCYDAESPSESMCEDLAIATENDQFAQGLTLCQAHQSTSGSRSVEERTCGCVELPIRWQ